MPGREVKLMGNLMVLLVVTIVGFLVVFSAVLWLPKKPPQNNEIEPQAKPLQAELLQAEDHQMQTQTPEQLELQRKRRLIREMALDAWNSYRQYAWGNSTVRPVSKVPGTFGAQNDLPGLTIVNSLSTLWVMGLMEQFDEGRTWVETQLDLSEHTKYVSIFTVFTHYVGALLSVYALTGDRMFLNKATEIAELMQPAFDRSKSGIPYDSIKLSNQKVLILEPSLSGVTGFQAELVYLSEATNRTRYRAQVDTIQKVLRGLLDQQAIDSDDNSKQRKTSTNRKSTTRTKVNRPTAPLLQRLPPVTGGFSSAWADVGLDSREFYRSVLAVYVRSPTTEVSAGDLFTDAIEAVTHSPLFVWNSTTVEHSPGNGRRLTVRSRIEYWNKRPFDLRGGMHSDTCYLGAVFGRSAALHHSLFDRDSFERWMGGADRDRVRIMRHWELAEHVTDTCHFAATATATGLVPEWFQVNANQSKPVTVLRRPFSPTAELAESYFVLWRLTGELKYRDYAWQYVQALNTHCRQRANGTDSFGGVSDLKDVNQVPAELTDKQNPLVLSATLKYLYLTFTEGTADHELPLDRWVFTSAGHPLPIKDGDLEQ